MSTHSSPILIDPSFTTLQLAYDERATLYLIEFCNRLSRDQFVRSHDIGPPPHSLQAVISHIITGVHYVADILYEREHSLPDCFDQNASRPKGLSRLLVGAHDHLRQALADFEGESNRHDLIWPADGTRLTLSDLLTQLLVHGAHHRAQCLYMLERIGHKGPLLWPISLTSDSLAGG